MATESEKLFSNLINEKHNILIQSLKVFIKDALVRDKEETILMVEDILKKSKNLRELFVSKDTPAWLNQIISHSNSYIKEPDKYSNSLMGAIIQYSPSAINNKIILQDNKNDEAIDIDSLFRKFKEEGNLQELLNKLIEIIQNIIDSGEIDSIKLTKALEKILATLKKSKGGSFLSLHAAWNFIKEFLQKFILNEIQNIGTLGSMLSALIETANKVEKEIEVLGTQVSSGIAEEFNKELSGFPLSSEPLLDFNQTPKLTLPKGYKPFDMKG